MAYHPIYETEISAPVDQVWALLIGFGDYPRWNTMISFKGEPEKGKTVPMKVDILGRVITTPVTFLRMDNNKELAWVGGLKGLFTGEHYFKLQKIDDERCLLIQGEKFRGLLLPVLWPVLRKTLDKLYRQTNEDIVKVFR